MQKIIELANSISNIPNGSPDSHQATDPPVLLLNAMIDDRLAEIALMCSKTPQTVEQIAETNQVEAEVIRADIVRLGQSVICGGKHLNRQNHGRAFGTQWILLRNPCSPS